MSNSRPRSCRPLGLLRKARLKPCSYELKDKARLRPCSYELKDKAGLKPCSYELKEAQVVGE